MNEIKLNFKWERDTATYANGENLTINKVTIANVFWGRLTKDDKNYKGNIDLPGIRHFRLEDDNIEEVKKRIEIYITKWFQRRLAVGEPEEKKQ